MPVETGPWVIFVEDPGAVNAIVPVVEALVHRQIAFRLFTAGQATRLMRERGLDPVPLRSSRDDPGDAIRTTAGLLIVGTSENPESKAFDLIVAARRKAIPSVAVIDAGANSAHRFRGTNTHPLTYAPDWLLVPDEWTSDAYKKLGLPKERIAVVGHPNDDRLREVFAGFQQVGRDTIRTRVFPKVATNQKVVTFLSELSTGLDPTQFQKSSEYTLRGRGRSIHRTEIVVEEILDAVEQLVAEGLPRPYLVLRLHPKETRACLGTLVSNFDEVNARGDPLSLVFASDLAIGMSSMLLAEAHRLGVPTLAVLPRKSERDWLPELRERRIPSITRRAELRATLRNFISEGDARIDKPSSLTTLGIPAVARILDVLESLVK